MEAEMGKRGPKPKGPFEGRTAVFSARLMPSTREMLEKSAKKNGRGISQEIEFRLVHSVDQDRAIAETYGGWENFGLFEIIAEAMSQTGAFAMTARFPSTDSDWTKDPWAYAQAMSAVTYVLEYFRPRGKIVPPKRRTVTGVPAELQEAIRTQWDLLGPRQAAYILASIANKDDMPGVVRTRVDVIRRHLQGSEMLSKIDKGRRKK